jgi:hypothetical protein
MSKIVDVHQQSSSANIAELACWCLKRSHVRLQSSYVINLILLRPGVAYVSLACYCVWYYMAKLCFLVTIPNEKLGLLKTPLSSVSRLIFLKYPLRHPLFLALSSLLLCAF